MKLQVIIALFILCMGVKGWVAMLQPIAATLGAVFAALNLDSDLITDIQPIAWFSSKSKTKEDEK